MNYCVRKFLLIMVGHAISEGKAYLYAHCMLQMIIQ